MKMSKQTFNRRRKPAGFTLLEVILALALTTVVLYTLFLAVRLQLHTLDAGRSDAEEAGLARALLRQIASDLRGSLRYDPLEADSADYPSESSADESGDQGATGTSDPATTATGEGSENALSDNAPFGMEPSDMEEDAAEDDGSTEDVAETGVASSMPGIYGNESEIQVDVCWPPRRETFQNTAQNTAEEEGTASCGPAGGTKAVAYYVVEPGEVAFGETREEPGGLVRRTWDRAAALYASDSGATFDPELGVELIAPEVQAIEFRYFDGTAWVDSWDTEQNEGLPLAIDVVIALKRIRHQSGQTQDDVEADDSEEDDDSTLYYRLQVDLPTAAAATADDIAADEATVDEPIGDDSASETP